MGRSSVRRCAAVRFRYFWKKDFQAGNLGSSQAGGGLDCPNCFLDQQEEGCLIARQNGLITKKNMLFDQQNIGLRIYTPRMV